MRHTNSRALTKVALLLSTVPFGAACSAQAASPGAATGGSQTTSSTPDAGHTTTPVSTTDGGVVAQDGGVVAEDGGGVVLPVVITYVAGATVSTLAGSDVAGKTDGTGAAAEFDNPTGTALDANGNLVVLDYDSALVRLVTPAGVVTTIASGTTFVDPFACAVSTDGKYYIGTDADPTGNKADTTGTLWVVAPASGSVVTPTVFGTGFWRPRGVAPMTGGNLFVVDRTKNVVEEVNASGQTTVIAGSGTAGYVDGTGASAQFNGPVGGAVMPDGSYVVPDAGNNRIRRITASGVVTTFAGNGSPTLVDGACAAASFNAPRGITADAAGNVYVSDIGNHVIRWISPNCTVQTVAGTMTAGFNDGPGNTAMFYGQEGVAVTPDGKTLYVSDGNGGDGSAYNRIRAIALPSAE